jgi:3-oxoacyl-[acyl-carrier protein] reductase
MLLQNQKAIVTGGGRGIGRAIALQFAREGADVGIIARTEKEITQVAAEIANRGRSALPVAADIADGQAVSEAIGQIQARFGRIDILVNNAGVEMKKPFVELTLAEWDRTMNVNARGAAICSKLVLPGMLKRQKGNIINIASGAGLRGLPGSTAYSASKAAMIAFTFALADEVRDCGIRVNVICPGLIETDMLDRKAIAQKPANALLPDDVAGTAVFLASALSGQVSGQVFSVRNSNRW